MCQPELGEERDQECRIRLLKAGYQITPCLAINPDKISLAIYGRNGFIKMCPRRSPGGAVELGER